MHSTLEKMYGSFYLTIITFGKNVQQFFYQNGRIFIQENTFEIVVSIRRNFNLFGHGFRSLIQDVSVNQVIQ